MKTPLKAKLITKSKSDSNNKITCNLNGEFTNSKNSSTSKKENQCRPKREASRNAKIKTSIVIQDELFETKRQKLANCLDFSFYLVVIAVKKLLIFTR